jgi:hypothetical protein
LTPTASAAANTARTAAGAASAVGTVGRGLMGPLNHIVRALSCASALASAYHGDFVAAAEGGLDCVARSPRPNSPPPNGPRPNSDSASGNGTCSFDGATLVVTDRGLVRIDSIRPEDMRVLSRDPETGVTAYQEILRHYANPYAVTVTLEIADPETGAAQTIVSNAIHPFFAVPAAARVTRASYEGLVYLGPIAGGAWVDAADLRPGDRLLQADGGWAEVTSVEIRARPLLAWNMSVAGTDSYFVTSGLAGDAVWVHNCPPGTRPESNSPPGAGRHGAFAQAKRDAGVPVSQQPVRVRENRDARENLQPGRQYDFEVPKPGGGTRTVTIRDDAAGHRYPDDPSQNRGPHFNIESPRMPGHYDY